MISNTSSIDTSIETPLTRMIKFVLFSAPLGPSLACSLYIIFCFIYDNNLRRRANHVMIAIIIIDFLELIGDLLPITLFYLYHGRVYSLSVCLYWVTGNYTMQGISAWLTAWASIDRYFLIFFRNRNTFLRHDLPILVVFISLIVWYATVTLTHPCRTDRFDGNEFLCGGLCFNDDVITATTDWVLIVLLPALLIVVFNVLLLVRVLVQKHRRRLGLAQRAFSWRKNMKIFIQLLSVSLVYLITQVPLVIISIVHLFGPDNFLVDISHIWLYCMPYLIYIVTPFAYVATTKDCRKHFCKWRNRIEPVAIVPLEQRQPYLAGKSTDRN